MALSNPRQVFGIHSVAPYDRDTGEYKGILKVLGSSSLNFSSEIVENTGGTQKYPYAIEDGIFTAEIALTFREYPDFVFELFLGKAPTSNAAESSGNCSTVANKSGTSLVDATTGIASVSVESGQEADLKFSKYVIVAVSSTTVDVYAGSDIDFARGDDLSYEDDLLKVTSSALTVPDSGSTVSVPNTGVEITGGSGTVSFTSGDTATFETRPINSESTTVTIGASASQTLPEFGMIAVAAKRGVSGGEMMEFDLFKVKGSGLPIGLEQNSFSEASVTARALYDSDKDGVYSMRHVIAT